MNKTFLSLFFTCIFILSAFKFLGTKIFTNLNSVNSNMPETIENIFDEMAVNECKGLRKARNIKTIDYYSTIYMLLRYKNVPENIESMIANDFYDPMGLGSRNTLNFLFTVDDGRARLSFYYNKFLNELHISYYEINGGLSLEERDAYSKYLLNEIIIREWLINGKTRYNMENLGDFKIVDQTVPYEYCGEGLGEALKKVTEDHENYSVHYSIWLDNEELLCVQQATELHKPINEEIIRASGHSVDEVRFSVKRKSDGKLCGLSDIVRIDEGFIEWMKESGGAVGNLQKITRSRGVGSANTQIMLKNCPEEEMQAALEQCEFYMQPGYLHIRFPYWNHGGKDPGWEKNGNQLWKGWLTMKTEDIEEFLKVGIW